MFFIQSCRDLKHNPNFGVPSKITPSQSDSIYVYSTGRGKKSCRSTDCSEFIYYLADVITEYGRSFDLETMVRGIHKKMEKESGTTQVPTSELSLKNKILFYLPTSGYIIILLLSVWKLLNTGGMTF